MIYYISSLRLIEEDKMQETVSKEGQNMKKAAIMGDTTGKTAAIVIQRAWRRHVVSCLFLLCFYFLIITYHEFIP